MTETIDKQAAFERWLEALENHEFEQTQSRLYDGEGYCCLGVVDKVVFGAEFYFEGDPDGDGTYEDDMGEDLLLHADRVKPLELDVRITDEEFDDLKLLLTRATGQVIRDKAVDRQDVLSRLNDAGFSFEAIAEWIREHNWHK